MANWTVTQNNTITAIPSVFETAGQFVNLTISPNYGYAISAANLIIGGATEVTSSTAGEYIFEGGNVDAEVEKVVFSNNGIAGQPTNTVNAKVYLNAMPAIPATVETWPASDTIYIDIDDRPDLSDPIDPSGDVSGPTTDAIERIVCLKTLWPYSSVQTVTVADLSNISETTTLGDASTQPNCIHSGNVNEGATTVIAKITFAVTDATANNYVGVTASFEGLTNQGFDYSNYYSSEIEYTYTSNLVTSFTVYISYTPPLNPSLNPDPQSTFTKFCEIGHQAFINYVIKETQGVTDDQVRSIAYSPSVPFTGGSEAISVRGSVGATYDIRLQKKESTDSIIPASTTPNYNFTSTEFQAAPYSESATISSSGVTTHFVKFPDVSVDTRYDIILTATGTSSLHADVPNEDGEAIMIQYGISTVTIKPFSTNSNYQSFDLAASTHIFHRPKPYTGSNYVNKPSKVIYAEGGNGNSSSTRVLLNTPVPTSIEPGMIIYVNNATGASIITHNTTVKSLYKNILTLSAAAAIPDNTTLMFVKNDSSLISFQITATASSGDLTAAGGSPSAIDIVSGAGSGTQQIDIVGNVNNSTTITLDYSSILQVGMKVTGPGITGEVDSNGVKFTTITAVNPTGRSITVATAQTLSSGDTLSFTSSDTVTIQSGITPLDIQYSVNTGTDVATIQGYLLAESVSATGDILLNIDTIITQS